VISASVTVAQGRLLRGRDPIALTAVLFLGAALGGLPFAATEGLPALSHAAAVPLAAAAALTITGTLVPFSLFAFAQKSVSAEVAGAFLNLEPLVGVLIGIVAFGDPFGTRQAEGGLAVLAGIALSSLPLLGVRDRAAGPLTRVA
jgi:drug/metabolite transporter (DMT)-like permease